MSIAAGLGFSCKTNVTAPWPTHDIVYRYFRDYDYATNRVFDLKPLGDTLQTGDSIIEVALFTQSASTGLILYPPSYHAILQLDPRRPEVDSQFSEAGVTMTRIDAKEYFPVISDRASNSHYVVFKHDEEDRACGAWLRVRGQRNGRDTTFEIGSIGDTTCDLLMLRPAVDYSPDHPVWPFMWRNCYEIPADFDFDHPDLRIFLGPPGTEMSPANLDEQLRGYEYDGHFVSLTGLDEYTRNGYNYPDGEVDFRPPCFRRDWNLIVFPSRAPFSTDTVFWYEDGLYHTVPLALQEPTLYNYTSLSQFYNNTKYYFWYLSVDVPQ